MEEKYSILYVDDEESNLKILIDLLRSDYNIFVAKSGAEGLKILERTLVDLIVAEQYMPDISSVEFLEKAYSF